MFASQSPAAQSGRRTLGSCLLLAFVVAGGCDRTRTPTETPAVDDVPASDAAASDADAEAPDAWQSATYRGGPARPGTAEGPALVGPAVRAWTVRLGDGVAMKGTPAWTETSLFVTLDSSDAFALDPLTGERRWAAKLEGKRLRGPALVDGRLLLGSDRGLTSLDPASGEHQWTVTTSPVNGAPAVVGGVAYVATTNGVVAVDLEGGTELWEAWASYGVQSSPAVRDDEVYAGIDKNRLISVDAGTGSRRWAVDLGAPVAATPTIGPQLVFVGINGRLRPNDPIDGVRALARADGSEAWRYRTKASVSSPFVRANGRIYFSSHAGRVVALDSKTGAEVWVFEASNSAAKGAANSGPILVENDLYIVMGRILYALDVTTGERRWKTEIEGAVSAPIAAGGGGIYVPTLSGAVYGFRAAPKKG